MRHEHEKQAVGKGTYVFYHFLLKKNTLRTEDEAARNKVRMNFKVLFP